MSTSAPAAVRRAGLVRPAGAAAPSLPRRWPRWLLVAAVAVLLAVGLLFATAGAHRIDPAAPPAGGAASAVSGPASLGGGPAATAVAALVAPGGSDLAPAVPPGFASFRGYTPEPERLGDGTVRLTHPDGACSIPGGGTRFRFDAACRAHDYGYDLLRYAAASGEPLPGDARKLIDGMFARDLREHCQATRTGLPALGCQATAEVFATGVAVNTWRQGYGNPADEPLPAWPLAAAAPVVAAPLLLRAWRRRVTYQNYPGGMSGSAPEDEPVSVWAGSPPRRILADAHSIQRGRAATPPDTPAVPRHSQEVSA